MVRERGLHAGGGCSLECKRVSVARAGARDPATTAPEEGTRLPVAVKVINISHREQTHAPANVKRASTEFVSRQCTLADVAVKHSRCPVVVREST